MTTNSFLVVLNHDKLVVSFSLNKVARGQTTEQHFSDFIISENKEGERNGRQPPVDFEGIHPQTLIHARSVTQKGSKKSFKDQSKVEHVVSQAL